MKRLLQILGFIILLLIAAAIILPIVFKDEIIARAKQEINNKLTATVDFKDIDISLFRSFPDFSLSIDEITVDGRDQFEGTRLAEIRDFQVDLNLFSVISGNQFKIKTIAIRDANIHVIIDTSGNANYDIVKSTEETPADTAATGPSDFKLTLKKYELENVNLVYDDRAGDMKAVIRQLNHSGKGDFTEEIVNLETLTDIESLTFIYGGIAYLEKVKAGADMDFEFNQPEFKISFRENELSLNDLKLNFDGFVALPEEDITMDLTFSTPQSEFKNVLSLIPTVYYQDFERVKTSGKFALNGEIGGTYNSEQEIYPSFDIKFDIDNGTFRYPDLPAAVQDIFVNAHIYNKTDNLDGTVVDIPRASAVVAGSPVNASLNLKTPVSDPAFKAYLKTDFELADIGKVVPAQGFDYKGHVKANLDLAGRMSDINNERYENVKAEGQLMAQNVVLKDDSLPFPVEIPVIDMVFSPQKVDLNAFQARLGRSDLSANGKIDNLLAYALEDKTLKADFVLTSGLLDLNELTSGMSSGEEATQQDAGETSSLEVIRIPQNIDFSLTADAGKVIYDNLEITNLKGTVALQEGAVRMDNLVMDLLGGSLAMNGSYDSKPAAPVVDMNLKINNFGFKESFEKFITIQKLVPIMQSTTGTYSTGLSLRSGLNPDMSPDLSTIMASGSLTTEGMTTSPKSLQKLAAMVKMPDLATLNIGKVNLSFTIENGRVNVQPFTLTAGNITATVQGSNGLDQTLDYRMDMKLPVSGIGSADLLNRIGAAKGGKFDLGVKIGGTFSDPKITTTLGDIVGNVMENIKQQVEQKVEEVKKEAVDKVNAKAQELIDAAEAQGDKLIASAEEQARKIREAAQAQADKLIQEANQRAKKLEDEAKGNILKEKGAELAADKIRSEAREQADNITREANKKADQLVNNAREQKEKLIEEAREKGRIENS